MIIRKRKGWNRDPNTWSGKFYIPINGYPCGGIPFRRIPHTPNDSFKTLQIPPHLQSLADIKYELSYPNNETTC